jgi:hypothetical protein
MSAKITLTCSWGPQYQPIKAEATGTVEELSTLLGFSEPATVSALTEKWTGLHVYNQKEFTRPKG